MALHPECDGAIEDVVNEAIVSDLYDSPIEIELSNLNATDKLKTAIRQEFRYIKELLDFDKKSHEIFRNWYIDGRLYYHKVIDLKKPQDGIKELRYIDPMKMRFVRQEKKRDNNSIGPNIYGRNNENNAIAPEIEEYFVYTPKPNYPTGMMSGGGGNKGTKIAKDAITYCTSGLVDRNKGSVLSYLHKAIKALNQLRMIEDSLVIYRLSRAPERRIFYIDVGNLPKVKAEQYLRDVMMRYRNKLVYDANTGEVRDDRKFMSMMEDFWLPRREGGRGTEISTLPGGENLGQIDDIIYFQKRLYRSLNVPINRLEQEAQFSLGRSTEISRDELKFQKFIDRLRKRFSMLFLEILKKQLIMKGLITEDDWNEWKNDLVVDYIRDNHFTELKDAELLRERLQTLDQVSQYVGEYFSKEWVMKNVLMFNDDDIKQVAQQSSEEEPTQDDVPEE